MRTRLIAVAAFLAVGSEAHAEPAKTPAVQADQPQRAPAKPVVLAAAETVKATVGDSAQAAPTQSKHRIARVTTCRCGDPGPGETTDGNPEQ